MVNSTCIQYERGNKSKKHSINMDASVTESSLSKTLTMRTRFCCAAPFAQQCERILPKRTRRSTKLSSEKAVVVLAPLTATAAAALELDRSAEFPGDKGGRRLEGTDNFVIQRKCSV